MNLDSLPPDSTIIPASMMAELDDAPVAAKYWPGVAYTSAINDGPSFSPSELEHIPVGKQEHAISTDEAYSLKADAKKIAQRLFKEDNQLPLSNDLNKPETYKVKIIKDNARKASRKLLLADRAKNIIAVCPTTGIVSQMMIPAIPGQALVWDSPLSDLSNCRGIAQRGKQYLMNLDTQVLAGILIVLAESYDLFQFLPADTGAQKNAILRTAGKLYLAEAIILVEDRIHSGNYKFMPKFSLKFDSISTIMGVESALRNYLALLSAAILTPDTSKWDDNALPSHRIRPQYVDKKQTVSYLAKSEKEQAEKQFKADKKAGKIAIVELAKVCEVTVVLKQVLAGWLDSDTLLHTPYMLIARVVEKLETYNSPHAATLIKILKTNRKILLEEFTLDELEDDTVTEDNEQDDPTPGNEASVEDDADYNAQLNNEEAEGTNTPAPSFFGSAFNGEEPHVNDTIEALKSEPKQKLYTKDDAPSILGVIQRIRWANKMNEAQGLVSTKKAVQNTSIPSVAVYVPSANKNNLGRE